MGVSACRRMGVGTPRWEVAPDVPMDLFLDRMGQIITNQVPMGWARSYADTPTRRYADTNYS